MHTESILYKIHPRSDSIYNFYSGGPGSERVEDDFIMYF